MNSQKPLEVHHSQTRKSGTKFKDGTCCTFSVGPSADNGSQEQLCGHSNGLTYRIVEIKKKVYVMSTKILILENQLIYLQEHGQDMIIF
jgi:hypothetical protein